MSTIKVVPNYRPNPKQILLHTAPVSYNDLFIILYGGKRGGGKSAGILMDAVQFATKYPGAKCVIFRESLDAVKQSFLDKLPTLLPQEVEGVRIYEWREKSTSFYPSRCILFPNGSYITLQRCANYNEARRYQGYEFHYLAIDEVTKQEEKAVDYLLTLVRSAKVVNPKTGEEKRIPTKVVFGCNPGGIGHKWVKRRFIDPTVTKYDPVTNEPLETRDVITYVKHPAKKDVSIKTTIRFIPASYLDNPFLSDAYVVNLLNQPEHIRQMDLFGNWDIVAGRMFELKDEQIIEESLARRLVSDPTIPKDIYVSIDWGYRPSYHCALWHAIFPDGRCITFDEMYGQDLVFEDFVKEIANRSAVYDIAGTCLPHDMFRHGDRYRDETGKIIGETKSDVFEYHNLIPISVASGKGLVTLRYDKIHSAMELKTSDDIYRFRISRACQNLIEELNNAVYDDFNPERMAPACKDHAIDAYGLFLVYYSTDIAPLELGELTLDRRSRIQKKLEEEEEYLDQLAEMNTIGVDNYFDL